MQAAWEQVGDVLAAERAFSLARLSRDVLKRVEVRHLAKLPPERAAGGDVAGACAHRVAPDRVAVRPDGRRDVAATSSSTARCAVSTSARRATFRMAQWRERDLGRPSVTAQMTALVKVFANASQQLDAIDPNRFVPDGLMGSRSYDSGAAARRPRDRRRSDALHRPRR